MGGLAGLQQAQFSGSVLRHQNHTVRKNTLQFARSEIHQDEHLLSDQLFGREMLGDSRNYLAFVDTRINRQFQQFLRFGDFFGRQNRRNANIHFLKIIELNRIFLRFNI